MQQEFNMWEIKKISMSYPNGSPYFGSPYFGLRVRGTELGTPLAASSRMAHNVTLKVLGLPWTFIYIYIFFFYKSATKVLESLDVHIACSRACSRAQWSEFWVLNTYSGRSPHGRLYHMHVQGFQHFRRGFVLLILQVYPELGCLPWTLCYLTLNSGTCNEC